jgi:hypothetical protein
LSLRSRPNERKTRSKSFRRNDEAIAICGQPLKQQNQRMHFLAVDFSVLAVDGPDGQSSAHTPQCVHFAGVDRRLLHEQPAAPAFGPRARKNKWSF